MDIQRILQGVARATGLNQTRLSEAARQAEKYRNINSRQEAVNTLHRIGVNDSFLAKVQGVLDSPIAQKVAPFVGINPKEASSAIEQLKGGNPSKPAPDRYGNRLDVFKRDLNRIQRK